MVASFSEALSQARANQQPSPPPTGELQQLPIQTGQERFSFSDETERLREQTAQGQTFIEGQVGQELGPSGAPAALRFDLSFSDTFEEKRVKFMDKFPDGEFLQVREAPEVLGEQAPGAFNTGRGDVSILFRTNLDEPLARLDAPAFEAFEPLGDLADLAGTIPSVVAEIAFTRGGALISQVLRAAAASTGGELLKEGVEALRGFSRETLPELFGRTAIQAAGAGVGTALSVAVTGPLNAFRGKSLVDVSPGGREAISAARELDVPGLLPTQVATSPLLRRIGDQSQATVSTMVNYVREQNNATVRSLLRLGDKDLAKFAQGDLLDLHEQASRQAVRAAEQYSASGVALTDKTLSEGGRALQQGIREYEDLSQAIVTKAYKTAQEIEEPSFDISPLRETAKDIADGPQFLVNTPGPDDTVTQSAVQAGASLEGELASAVAIIRDMDDAIAAPGTSSIEALTALRQTLWELKTPAPGEIMRAANKQAARLYGAITQVLNNPTNAAPGFTEAWQTARKAAAERFSTMERIIVTQAGRSETPAQLAVRLAKPNQADNLRSLKAAIPADKWSQFQESSMADMVSARRAGRLTDDLDAFDADTLNELFTPRQQSVLRSVAGNLDTIKAAKIPEVAAQQAQASATIQAMLGQPGSRQAEVFSQLLSTASEGQARSIRAAIIENVISRSTRVVDNNRIIDADAFKAAVSDLREAGVWKALTPEDRRILSNLDKVIDFIPSQADAGTSIQAASTAAGLREFSGKAFKTLLEVMGTGRAMTSPGFQRVLLGTGKEAKDFLTIRRIGAILGTVATEENRQQGIQ